MAHPGGRPTKLTPEVRQQVARLAPLGLTDRQFAAVLGVSERAFQNWKADEEFMHSLKVVKGDADSHVVKSLYQSALDGNPTSCIFWLKNRQPKEWRDKTEVAVTGVEDIFKAMDDAR